MEEKKTLVGIVMGSDSDLLVMSEAAKILDEFGIEYELTIVSAHRTPQRLFAYGSDDGSKAAVDLIIAGAGGAAHLPGMLASISAAPVIGVPIKTSSLNGIDSLLSIVQMPGGIPVATVAINGAKNAGILAAQILGVKDPEIREKVLRYKSALKEAVERKAEKLEDCGYAEYLKGLL